MARPLIFIHGYSDKGEAFIPLRNALKESIELIDVDICTYVSLNNEVTIKDIAEGLERAFGNHPTLKETPDFEFDAVVHSTGMLVIRSWLTNYGIKSTAANGRLKRLKHLIGLAPATWGSPQAHKGRTWLGALVKGNKDFLGPDFLNAGDRVLEGLELGSSFTWDLAHLDLLGKEPYYDKGPNTPFVAVFIGNTPYEGLESVANDPGTDGTVRWAGCGLNTRKIRIDLTRTPTDIDGNLVPLNNGVPLRRAWISDFADSRLDVPMIAVGGRNHGTILKDPEPDMVDLIARFLKIGEEGGETHDDWLKAAKSYGDKGVAKMLENPNETFFGRLFHDAGEDMEGWQQFVVHATDERGDPVTDYMIEVLKDGQVFKPIYTDVHAYGLDQSYRCFHIHLPKGITSPDLKLTARIHASTGTDLMTYQGYSPAQQQLTAESQPVELELNLGSKGSLFFPFTTTLIEIVLNREPRPLDKIGRILTWIQATE
jgi:hypothetical protein